MPARSRSCPRRSGAGRDLYLPRHRPYTNGGVLDLRELGGLALLYDPEVAVDLVSGDVSRLPNIGFLGSSADLLQGTAGNRPTLTEDDPDMKGRRTLSFNGSTDFLSTAGAVTPWPGTTATLFAVHRGTTSSNHRIFGQDWNTTTGIALIRSSTDAARAMFASSGLNTLKSNGSGQTANHIQVATFNVNDANDPIHTYLVKSNALPAAGTLVTAYAGGKNATAIGAIPTARWSIGGLTAGGGELLNGRVAIAGAFSRALSIGEVRIVADYLQRRFM